MTSSFRVPSGRAAGAWSALRGVGPAGVALTLVAACAWPAAAAGADAAFVLAQHARTSEALDTVPLAVGRRAFPMVDIAVFNALDAITPRYASYRWSTPPVPEASADAAILVASSITLTGTVGASATKAVDAWTKLLAAVPDGPAKRAGVELGRRAALAILLERADDADLGRQEPASIAAAAGVYVLTPGYKQQIGTEMTTSRPFAIASVSAFDPGPPPVLGSARDLRDLAEVKAVGDARSTVRTPDQTAAAIFWNSGGGDDDAPMWEKAIADHHLDALATARLLALQGMSSHDAAVAMTTYKHKYNRWRPYTAIRSPWVSPALHDAQWTPLLRTHPHQDYPSAACTFTGVELHWLHSLQVGPVETYDSATGQTRSWPTADARAQEVANARVWAGVHFRSASEAGLKLGQAIAAAVDASQLRPLDEAPAP